MNEVAQELRVEHPTPERVKAVTDASVQLLVRMKAQIDSLATEIQKIGGH